MYLAIIVLPLLGSIVSGFFGRKVGVSGAQFITCLSVIITTILALVAFFEVGLNNIPVSIVLFRWIDSESLNVLWGFHFDCLTVSMLIPVLIVSSLVHIYSIGYMSHDPRGRVRGKRVYGGKLSNSGELLKLKVPSHNLKIVSGWSNYSGMVTSLKMSENSMDNRGSKSEKNKSVKEQRVDGSWSKKCGAYLDRNTLNGSFIKKFVGISIKTIFFFLPLRAKKIGKLYTGKSYISTVSKDLNLNLINPWFVTGFSDGEACFILSITKSKERKIGWRFNHCFQITLHKKDKELLEQLQGYFGGVEYITKHRSESVHYRVQSLKDLLVILNHFDKYPLITLKWVNYQLFKSAIMLIINKEHLTEEGLRKIVSIKASLNWGLSDELKVAFPDIIPGDKPVMVIPKIPSPEWIAGFTSAEGSFFVNIRESSASLNKKKVQLNFIITQHINEQQRMRNLIEYFGCGNIYFNGQAVYFRVTKFSEINDKVISFFKKHKVLGVKYKDFEDLCIVAELMETKAQLTKQGFDKIQLIKNRMNTGRESISHEYDESDKPHLMDLRCTLRGSERNRDIKLGFNMLQGWNSYIKIPSKQFDLKKFSTYSSTIVNPGVWSGLIDGEGSFSIIVVRNKARKLGWRVQLKFQIGLDAKDINLLYLLQQHLGGIGSIHLARKRDRVKYSIDSMEDLNKLIFHLEKYPLLTQKAADFLLFKKAVELVNNKAHLTVQGVNKIVNIKASMNLGLSDILKSEFAGYTPVERPVINYDNVILDPYWISGFVSAEGNFDVRIPSTNSKLGYRVQLRFTISQHSRDFILMQKIVEYFGSGKIYKYGGKSAVSLSIVDFTDITNIIVPFFNKNPLIGIKLYDYLDWCKIHSLMLNGSHLTVEGINSIRKRKSGMNTGRYF